MVGKERKENLRESLGKLVAREIHVPGEKEKEREKSGGRLEKPGLYTSRG